MDHSHETLVEDRIGEVKCVFQTHFDLLGTIGDSSSVTSLPGGELPDGVLGSIFVISHGPAPEWSCGDNPQVKTKTNNNNLKFAKKQ
jgi:hypothetical protein